jgi:hypothetical protein
MASDRWLLAVLRALLKHGKTSKEQVMEILGCYCMTIRRMGSKRSRALRFQHWPEHWPRVTVVRKDPIGREPGCVEVRKYLFALVSLARHGGAVPCLWWRKPRHSPVRWGRCASRRFRKCSAGRRLLALRACPSDELRCQGEESAFGLAADRRRGQRHHR